MTLAIEGVLWWIADYIVCDLIFMHRHYYLCQRVAAMSWRRAGWEGKQR